MNRGAVSYIVRTLIQRTLGLGLFLLGARGAFPLRAAVYFALYFATAIFSLAVLYRAAPDTLARRGKVVTDSPKWDKVLLGLYWALGFFAVYLAAGLEAAGTLPPPGALLILGAVLFLAAAGLSLWALMVNPFLESTARVQTDRDQTVCAAGPYEAVRHPAYAAVLLWCVSVSMIFGTPLAAAVAGAAAAVIVIRTALEDRMLRKKLPGYEDYARRVRYRLLPGVW